jgi:hypothetical protein
VKKEALWGWEGGWALEKGGFGGHENGGRKWVLAANHKSSWVHKQNSEAEYKTRMTKERWNLFPPRPSRGPHPKKKLEFGTHIQKPEPEKRGKKKSCYY